MIRKNNGFTLLELLMLIFIASLAAASIYIIYDKAKTINNIRSELKLLVRFKRDVENAWQGESTYGTLNNTAVNMASITPTQYRDGTISGIRNRFGGRIDVYPISFGGFQDVGFRIDYGAVDPKICPNLSLKLISEFDVITINGNTVKNYGDSNVSINTVTAACNSVNMGARMAFDSFSEQKRAIALATSPTPFTPSSGTIFRDATTPLVCDLSDPYFLSYASHVPANAKSMLITLFRNIDNHAGRCPTETEFRTWIDELIRDRDSIRNRNNNPAMNYPDTLLTVTYPKLYRYGNTAYTRTERISQANSACQRAATSQFGYSIPAIYQIGSGNRCIIN